jgi:prepilin-type N-terminal cleavage/methylation domain-containing protein/prepilin-type processing-associated H-X9-DG protein
MPPFPRRVRAAFSLVETLVVTAIIGILAALLFPTVESLRNKGQQTKCAGNLRQLGAALLQYAGENAGSLPPGNTWDREISSYLNVSEWNTAGANSAVLTCPADRRSRPLANGKFPRSYTGSQIKPADPTQGVFGDGAAVPSRRLVQITQPSRTILLFEMFTTGAGAFVANEQFMQAYGYSSGYQTAASTPRLSNAKFYHGTSLNYLFADGHLESLPPHLIYTPPNNLWRALPFP